MYWSWTARLYDRGVGSFMENLDREIESYRRRWGCHLGMWIDGGDVLWNVLWNVLFNCSPLQNGPGLDAACHVSGRGWFHPCYFLAGPVAFARRFFSNSCFCVALSSVEYMEIESGKHIFVNIVWFCLCGFTWSANEGLIPTCKPFCIKKKTLGISSFEVKTGFLTKDPNESVFYIHKSM